MSHCSVDNYPEMVGMKGDGGEGGGLGDGREGLVRNGGGEGGGGMEG